MPDTFPRKMTHPLLPPANARTPAEYDDLLRMNYEPIKITPYAEFPKTLVHPDYAPARLVSPARHGPPVSADYPHAAAARLQNYQAEVWAPERFPAVTANNAEEEKKFIAQGYLAAGTPDAAAFSKAVTANPAPEEARPFLEFPQWVKPPDGGEAVLAKSADEKAALLAKWASKPRDSGPGARP